MNNTLKTLLLSFSIMLLIIGCAKQEEQPFITVDNAISADGVSIKYEVRGEGKPALVFIHGWCCDRETFNRLLEETVQEFVQMTKSK